MTMLNTLRRLAEDRKRPMVFPKVIHDRFVHGPTNKYKMMIEATEGQYISPAMPKDTFAPMAMTHALGFTY